MKRAIFKAKYKPRSSVDIATKLRESNCVDSRYFDFIYAYKLDDGSRHWEPVDINFPIGAPIDERDLSFKDIQ
jgi:hypothetical protein